MNILKPRRPFRSPSYGANRASTEKSLDEHKSEKPREHSLLSKDGRVIADGLSEFEMVKILTETDEGDGLFEPGSEEDRFEVHYVTEEHELDVMLASRWLDQKICTYNTPGFSASATDIHDEPPVSQQLSERGHDTYVEAVMDNDYATLQTIFQRLSHSDPSVMYGLRFMLSKQESFFERGVIAYGGHFVTKLLPAYRVADPDNREEIRSTWPLLWIKYVGMGINKSQEQ